MAGCLREGCPAEAKIRGLCRRHYQLLYVAIRRGETTWEKELGAGRVLPAQTSRNHAWGWTGRGRGVNRGDEGGAG